MVAVSDGSSTANSHRQWEQAIQEAANRLPSEHQPLFSSFLAHIQEAGSETADLLHGDPKTVLDLFNLLLSPPQEEPSGIKVVVQAGNSCPIPTWLPDSCVPETRLLIHLEETPFLQEMSRQFLKQRNLVLHARSQIVLVVERDGQGKLLAMGRKAVNGQREMLMLLLVSGLPETQEQAPLLEQLQEDLLAVLMVVKASVEDFSIVSATLRAEVSDLEKRGYSEEAGFVRWLMRSNFVFMGLCTVHLQPDGLVMEGPSFGVLRREVSSSLLDRTLPGVWQEMGAITRAASKENVLTLAYIPNRPELLPHDEGVDFFTIRRPRESANTDANDSLLLVMGRFSRSGLKTRPSTIPWINTKTERIVVASGYSTGSSQHSEFLSLCNRFPLRELFYAEHLETTRRINAMARLRSDDEIIADARLDHFGYYASVLVVFSRNRYRPYLEQEIAAICSTELRQTVTGITIDVIGVAHVVVCYAPIPAGASIAFDQKRTQARLRTLTATWDNRLQEVITAKLPRAVAAERFAQYGHAFEAIYRDVNTPEEALADIAFLEQVFTGAMRTGFRIFRHANGALFCKLYQVEPLELSRAVHIFSNFGISCCHEISSKVTLTNGKTAMVQRYELTGDTNTMARLLERAGLIGEAFNAILDGKHHDDPLNQLIPLEGLSAKEVMLIRALRQFLLQLLPHIAATAVDRAITTHYAASDLLVRAFLARFDLMISDEDRQKLEQMLRDEFEGVLKEVHSLLEDQILRGLFAVVAACLRTSYFRRPGIDLLSLKFDGGKLPGATKSAPWREIFVFSPNMEGVHLRVGPIARGGIRFSERPEDYRTEVLGLMHTQMIKNALITPTGAKGGFVVPSYATTPSADRPALLTEQYAQFIRGLLDVTDNWRKGVIIQPAGGVIHDGTDPYLVVAADKGTAPFSDLANQIVHDEYAFWLGDAFASGGSNGYNHKTLGITARGVWECIHLHFMERGRDLSAAPITVVGIGDMSGDVFGNGMLLHPGILLVGAFDHRHIFLDPDPDPVRSHRERTRLFALPRSSWSNYNSKLLSHGGGVFERGAKAIPLNGPLRELLGTDADYLSGEEVIRLLLCARVDLLFNGGIGTYVKGSKETPEMVRDKANDRVRVDGRNVRALVVAEGGNLGFTHQGRMEYAINGGSINSDAIDNSAGVDLSDREVNLKILLDRLRDRGDIADDDHRNKLLEQFAEEMAQSVLNDNRLQHMAISRDRLHAHRHFDQLLDALSLLNERTGLEVTSESITQNLFLEWNRLVPRPLLALLLGWAKIFARQELRHSEVTEMFFCERFLSDYFPVSVAQEFGDDLSDFVLKREIIASVVANRVINNTGAIMLLDAYNQVRRVRTTPDPFPTLIKAYLIVETLLDADSYREQVRLSSRALSQDGQFEVLAAMEAQLLHQATWMTTHLEHERISTDVIVLYGRTIHNFRHRLWDELPKLLAPEHFAAIVARRDREIAQGLHSEAAATLAMLPFLRDVMAILHIKEEQHVRFDLVGHLYIRVDNYFGISWIEDVLTEARRRGDRWGALMLENLRKDLGDLRARLVRGIVTFKRSDESMEDAFREYLEQVEQPNAVYQSLLKEIQHSKVHDLLPMTVLANRLRNLLLEERRGYY